jgi:glycosyltransferase involved in cell wall biosynthesis
MTVDIVIPVYNEENNLTWSISTLRVFLQDNLDVSWNITIADNASTDNTWEIARSLSEQHADVTCFHLDLKGRGRALRHAWLNSQADILAYMDVDLATDIGDFPHLVQEIEAGADIAIGSRLLRTSNVKRSTRREILSRGYNLLIRAMFRVPFHDAQCGFKAVSRDAAHDLIPRIEDQAWFFDTELLLLAVREGYRIAEIPVTWKEAEGTTVHIKSTVLEDIKGLLRLRFRSR